MSAALKIAHMTDAAELAEALGLSRSQVDRLANKGHWFHVVKIVNGGRKREFPADQLPDEIRVALEKHRLRSMPAPVVANSPAVKDVAAMANWERDRMDARRTILAHLDRMVEESGTIAGKISTFNAAASFFLEQLADRTLAPEIAALVPIANARSSGQAGRLTRSTIYNWRNARAAGDANLAPRDGNRRQSVPAWAATFLQYWKQPQKKSLAAVLDEMARHLDADQVPSYGQARSFLAKLDFDTRNAGRYGPREMKRFRPYVKRSTEDMHPGDVYICDGHTFDAAVAHPISSKAFRPEVTAVLDVTTRRCCGWSIDLAENALGTREALLHACHISTVPAIYYADHGAGQNNKLMDADMLGLINQLDLTKARSAPYASQARGVIERFHQSVFVRAAKMLPTYMGAAMDDEARKRVHKIVSRDLAINKTSRHLMPWQDFYAFISAEIDAYNNRPHRSLPRVRDSETGKMRHMSPNERWGDCIASGWQPDRLSESELVRYRRPSEVRTTRRGLVQIGGGDYFHQDLAIYHDDNVIVAFDIHDTSRVWVSDMEGRHICEAELDGHSRPYMPRSYVEQAREKRLAGQEKRVRDKLTVIENERDAGRVIEHRPAPQQTIPAEEIARLAADFERADDAVVVPLGNDVDRLNRFRRVCQGIAYGDEVSEADRAWVAGYVKTPEGQRNLEVMRDLDASLADLDFGGTDAG